MLTDRAANMAELSSADTQSSERKPEWENCLGDKYQCKLHKEQENQYKDKRGNVRTNVTSRRVHVTIFAVYKEVLHILSVYLFCQLSTMQSTCAVFYTSFCDLTRSTIFFGIISLTSRFSGGGGRSYCTQTVCSHFLYNFSLKTFLILRRIPRDVIRNIQKSSRKVPVILSMLMTLEFLDRFSKKYSNTKFHENPFIWSRVFLCGLSAGQTWRS